MGEQAHGDEELAIVNVEHARRISDTFRPNKTKKKSVIPKTVVQEIWKNRLAPRFYSTLMKVMFPENAKEVSFLSFYTIYKNLAEPEAEIMFRALTIYHIATIHEPPFNYEQADEYPNAPLKNIKDYVCDVITSYLHAIIQVQVKEALGWMELRASNSLVDGNLVAAYLLKDLEAHRNEVSIGSLEIWLEKNEIYYTVSEQLYLYLFGVNKSIDVKSLIPFPIVQGTKSANLKTLLSLPDVLLLNSKLPKRAPRWTLAFLLDSRNSGDWETFKQVIYGRGQTMIVIQDGNGDVFGMYGSQQWFPTTGFFGNRQSFLFTLKPDVNVYEPSGRNTNFQIFTESGIGMGGTEEQFGLFINYGAKSGSTSLACSTFRQFWPLASELDFKIEQFELWIVDEDPIAYSSEIKLDAKEDKKKIFDLLSENLETSKQTHEVTKTVITEKDNIMLRTEHDISRKVKDSASPTKINNLQQNLTTVTKTGDHLGKETIKETTTKVTTVVHETFQKQRNQDSGEKCRLETGTKQLSGDKSTNHTAKLHKGFIQECNRDLERSPTAEARNVKTLQEGRRSFVHPSEKQDGDIRRSPKLQANKGDFVHPSLKQKQETGIRKCRLETGTKRLSEDKSINHTAKLHKGCIQECKRDLERSPLAEARNVKAAQGGRRSFVHPSEKQDGDIRRSQKPQEADEGGFVHPSLKPKQESSLLINNKNQNARVPPDSSATEGSTVLITNMAQVSSQTIKGAIPKSSKVTEITINNSTVEGSKNYSGSSRTKEITNDITFIKLPLRMNGTSLVEVQVQVGESKLLRPTCRMSNKKHCACAVRHPCNCNVVVKNLSKTVSSGEKSNKLTFKSEYQEKTVIHDFVSNKLPSPPTLSVIAPDSKPERIYSTTKSSDAEYQEKTEIRDIITNKLPSTQTLSIIAPDNKPHTSDFTTNKLPSTQALPVVAQDNKPERIYSSTKSSDVNTTIKSSDVNTTIKSSDVNTTIKSSDVNTTLNSLDVNTTINNTIITEETVESSLPTPPQNVTSPLILESKDILSTVSKDVKDSCPEDGCRCSSSTDTSSDWEGGAISCTLDKLKLKSECSCQCEATLLGDSNITSKCKIDVGSSSLCSCVLGPKDQGVAKSSPEEEPSATEIPSDPSFFSKKETQYLTRSSKKSEKSLRYEVNDNLSKSLPSLSSDNNHGFFPSSNKNNTYSSTISSKNSFISSRSAKGVQLSISSRSHHMCSEPLVERSPLKKSPVPTNETNEPCIFSPTRSCKKTNILLGPGESCQSSNSMSSARISSNKCESRSCSQQAKHFLTTNKMNSYTKCSNTETQCLTQLSKKSETSKTPGSSTQLGLPIPPTCLKCRTMVKTAGCRCGTRDTIKNAPIVEQAPKLLQRPGPSGRSSISERNIDTESKSKRKSIEGLGGTEASPGLFINWTLRVGTTSTRCVTFNKFWQLSRDLVFDIKLVELWVVNEVLSRKRNIPHRDFYNTVVMWSKIGRNKDGNEKTKGRKQNAASCPAGTCCGCQQPEQAPSHVQIEETDLQYFDPSCISEPYQNCEEFHPYNTSATPCFTSCECAATQTSNYQIPTGRYAAVNANTPCTQRIPRYKAASTGMSRSTLYSNNSACVQTTRSLQDNNCNITTTQQSSCQTTPVPRKLPTRRISCQTSSSRMRSATTPNSCQTTSSLQNSSTRRVSCQTSSSIQNPSNRSSPSHQESPGPVSQQNIKMDDVIVGITRQEMCCCGSNIPEIECFCSKRFKKNKKDKKNKKSRKSDKESKKEERERAKREKIEEKERKKREKQEEKERKKEEKKKGKKKDKKKKGDKKSNECVCCKCEEFTTVDEDQSDSSDTHKSKKSKKKKEKKKKEKKPKEKKQKGSKKSKKEKQTSKERSKSRSRSRSRETTCRMYGDARPCYCPMNPTTQPVASPSRVEVRDVPRRQSSRKLDKDCHIGCGCPTSGAPIVCPPCPPTKPVAYYSQKPPTIMSEDVRQNYSSSSVKLNPSCSSSCNCFKIKSICSCNCSHKVNNYSVTVGPREVPYNEVHDSVDSTGNNYQTAAPAMLLPNVEMGKGDSTDPTFIGKLAKSELPRLTPLPATYTQTGNIVINVSKREEGTNANNKSYSKHFVPPCVLYLDCTKVKDMCVIIRDKYEET